MVVNLNQYRGTVGTFNNHNYYIPYIDSRFRVTMSKYLLFKLHLPILQHQPLVCITHFSVPNSYRSTKHFHTLPFLVTIITIWSLPCLYSLLLLLSADVELNPGPKCAFTGNISICHWYLNSISAHNYTKLFLLKAYIAIHKFDIICLSETYLILALYTSDDDNLAISG